MNLNISLHQSTTYEKNGEKSKESLLRGEEPQGLAAPHMHKTQQGQVCLISLIYLPTGVQPADRER